MATEQKWDRKESIIWPPRGFYYTSGAAFLALVFTGFLAFGSVVLLLPFGKSSS